jgi:hypothetical protein
LVSKTNRIRIEAFHFDGKTRPVCKRVFWSFFKREKHESGWKRFPSLPVSHRILLSCFFVFLCLSRSRPSIRRMRQIVFKRMKVWHLTASDHRGSPLSVAQRSKEKPYFGSAHVRIGERGELRTKRVWRLSVEVSVCQPRAHMAKQQSPTVCKTVVDNVLSIFTETKCITNNGCVAVLFFLSFYCCWPGCCCVTCCGRSCVPFNTKYAFAGQKKKRTPQVSCLRGNFGSSRHWPVAGHLSTDHCRRPRHDLTGRWDEFSPPVGRSCGVQLEKTNHRFACPAAIGRV